MGPLFQNSEGHLRVRVVHGTPISKTLRPGEMNYLTAVALVQEAQSCTLNVDEESAAMIAAHCEYSAPERLSNINCLDPWLFGANQSTATQTEKQGYYHKVWRLFYHFNHWIMFAPALQFWRLRLVKPSSSTLEITVVVCSLKGPEIEESHVIGKDDIEGSRFILKRVSVRTQSDPDLTTSLIDGLRHMCEPPDNTSSRTLKREKAKRIRSADEYSPSESSLSSTRNGKAFGSTQSNNDHSHNRSILTSSSLPQSNTYFEAKDLSEEKKVNEEIQKDRDDEEDKRAGQNEKNGQDREDEEDNAERRNMMNNDCSNQSNESSLNQPWMNAGDMPPSTGLNISDQAWYMQQEFPDVGWQPSNLHLASTVVAPSPDWSFIHWSEAFPNQRKLPRSSFQHLGLCR